MNPLPLHEFHAGLNARFASQGNQTPLRERASQRPQAFDNPHPVARNDAHPKKHGNQEDQREASDRDQDPEVAWRGSYDSLRRAGRAVVQS